VILLTGGPAWTETEKFDMAGKPDAPGQPNVDQMKMMIQKLLTDRRRGNGKKLAFGSS
jgi:uncharacterized protein (TIGR03435 family)